MTASTTPLYHVNPKEGAQPCGVTVGVCPFGEVASHYKTKEEAAQEFTRQMEEKHDPLAPAKRDVDTSITAKKSNIFTLPNDLAHVNREVSELDYDEIYDYAANSQRQHNNVRRLVKARNEVSDKITQVLEKVNPFNGEPTAVSGSTYLRMIEESRRYKRETDTLDRACTATAWKWNKSSVA